MAKPTKNHTLTLDLRAAILILLAVIIGFVAGFYFADHYSSSKTNSPSGGAPVICNCPMIPDGASLHDYCTC